MDYNDLHLYSESQKYKNDKKWFKDFMDYIDTLSVLNSNNIFDSHDRYRNMKINYDLYNNIVDKEDLMAYCGTYDYEFPENFIPENIITDKLKVLEGMEKARPFFYKVLAINPEATTRKEKQYFAMFKQYVVNIIMGEIKKQIEQEKLQQLQNKQPSKEDIQKIEQEVDQETKQQTPEEIKEYLERNHQDSAEILGQQLLNYLTPKLELKKKFNDGWKDVLKVAIEIYRVYIENNEPKLERINPLYFDYDKSTENKKIQDGEWAVAEYKYSMIDIIKNFPELTEKELKKITEDFSLGSSFSYDFNFSDSNITPHIPVKHYVWKSSRKIKFLTYIDVQTGELKEKIVDENYKLQKNYGDIELVESRIVEVYEGWRIGRDTYTKMGKLPFKRDIDDPNDVKLPYFGISYDTDNSTGTSLLDRLKSYQYLYYIVTTRLRKLMASDKGKILLMSSNLIPRSQNIDFNKWMEYMSKLNIGFFNLNEEGNKLQDINMSAKTLDLSLTSDIQKYVELASYIENRAGESVGITKQVVGRIGPNEAVGNTKQSLMQSSYILEPYFSLHELIKKETLDYLINTAALAYSKKDKVKLTYALDDMSTQIIKLDKNLLLFNTLGVFVNTDLRARELQQNIINLAHAALQNQSIEFSDVYRIIKTDNIEEANNILAVSEKRRKEELSQMQQMQMKYEQDKLEKERKFELNKIKLEKDLDLRNLQEKGKIDIERQTILAMGFDTNKDRNNNNIPDVLELADKQFEHQIKREKMNLEKEKFKHQKEMDKKKKEK